MLKFLLICLKWLLPFAVFIFVALWMLFKWVKKVSIKHEEQFLDVILSDILDLFSLPKEKIGQMRRQLGDALQTGKGEMPDELSSIFRIECLYEIEDDKKKKYTRSLLIYCHENPNANKCFTVKRIYSWEWLPSSVQTALLCNDQERLIILLYDENKTLEEK